MSRKRNLVIGSVVLGSLGSLLLFIFRETILAIFEQEVQNLWRDIAKPALASPITPPAGIIIAIAVLMLLVVIGGTAFLVKRSFSADSLFYSRSDIPCFEPRLEHGEDIWVSGITLRGLRIEYWDHFRDAVDQGKRFRFLLVDPDNTSALNILTANNPTFHQADVAKKILQETVECFQLLARESRSRRGAVEVRLLSSVPFCSMIIVDGDKPNGYMTVEMYGYQVAAGKRLGFKLTCTKDPQTFNFYLSQFHKMWDAARLPNIQEW